METTITIRPEDVIRPPVRVVVPQNENTPKKEPQPALPPDQLQLQNSPLRPIRQEPVLVDSTPDTFLARFAPRTTSHTIGSETIQLELGYRSQGPTVLTQAQDPTILETMKNSSVIGAAHVGNQEVVTGTVIKPDEALAVRVGFVSGVNLNQLGETKKQPADTFVHPDAYVGVSYGSKEIAVQTEIAQATIQQGQRRIGAGLAVSPVEGLKVAMSYQAISIQQNEQHTLKMGAEVFGAQDVVVGVNVSTPLQSPDKTADLTTGVYLNTRF